MTNEQYHTLIHPYTDAMNLILTRLEILNHCAADNEDVRPIHGITHRIKEKISMENKLKKKHSNGSVQDARTLLKDIAGIRVICFFERDIYQLAESLKKQTDLILVCEKDYIRHPNRTVTGAIILYWEFLFIHWMAWNTIRWKFSFAPFPWISGLPWNTGSAINPSPLMNSK